MKLWRGMENPSFLSTILKHSFEVHIKFNKHFALKPVNSWKLQENYYLILCTNTFFHKNSCKGFLSYFNLLWIKNRLSWPRFVNQFIPFKQLLR